MKQETDSFSIENSWLIWLLILGVSIGLHLIFFFSVYAVKRATPVKPWKRAKFKIVRKRPPPPPKPRVEKKPPPRRRKVKPKPRPKPRLRPKKKKRRKKRKLLKRQPPPPPSNRAPPKTPPRKPPKPVTPVFGLTMDSMSKKKGGKIAMRVGNTLMKDPEKRYTPPRKVQPYVAPRRVPKPRRRIPIKRGISFEPVPVYEVDQNPSILRCGKVNYPQKAKRMGIQAVVVLSIQIRKSGRVRRVRVVSVRPSSSRGYGLERAAIRLLRGCRFRPARYKGKPVDVVIRHVHRFEMDD